MPNYYYLGQRPADKLHRRMLAFGSIVHVDEALLYSGAIADFGTPIGSYLTSKTHVIPGAIGELDWGAGTSACLLEAEDVVSSIEVAQRIPEIVEKMSKGKLFLHGNQPAFIFFGLSVMSKAILIMVRCGSGKYGMTERDKLRQKITTLAVRCVNVNTKLGKRVLKLNDELLAYAQVNRRLILDEITKTMHRLEIIKSNKEVLIHSIPHNYIKEIDGKYVHYCGVSHEIGYIFGSQGHPTYLISPDTFKKNGYRNAVPAWTGMYDSHIGSVPKDEREILHPNVYTDAKRLDPRLAPKAVLPPELSLDENRLGMHMVDCYYPLGIVNNL